MEKGAHAHEAEVNEQTGAEMEEAKEKKKKKKNQQQPETQ